MCSCGSEPETTSHFLLRLQNHVIDQKLFIDLKAFYIFLLLLLLLLLLL